jgi:hypothetical protein
MGKFLPYHLPTTLLFATLVFGSIVALPMMIFHDVIDLHQKYPAVFDDSIFLCLNTVVGKAKKAQIIVMFILQFALPFPLIVIFTIMMILQVYFYLNRCNLTVTYSISCRQ